MPTKSKYICNMNISPATYTLVIYRVEWKILCSSSQYLHLTLDIYSILKPLIIDFKVTWCYGWMHHIIITMCSFQMCILNFNQHLYDYRKGYLNITYELINSWFLGIHFTRKMNKNQCVSYQCQKFNFRLYYQIVQHMLPRTYHSQKE